MAVRQPRNGGSGRVRIDWSGTVASRLNNVLKAKQKLVDSEVLRLCDPLIPFRTGTLKRSGTVATVIGSGEVKYSTPYARKQYYDTAETRPYDANRGAKWFERMKVAHKKEIEDLINKD